MKGSEFFEEGARLTAGLPPAEREESSEKLEESSHFLPSRERSWCAGRGKLRMSPSTLSVLKGHCFKRYKRLVFGGLTEFLGVDGMGFPGGVWWGVTLLVELGLWDSGGDPITGCRKVRGAEAHNSCESWKFGEVLGWARVKRYRTRGVQNGGARGGRRGVGKAFWGTRGTDLGVFCTDSGALWGVLVRFGALFGGVLVVGVGNGW